MTKTKVAVNVDRTVTVDFDLKTAAIEMGVVTVEAESEVVPMDVSGSQAVVTSEEMDRSVARNVGSCCASRVNSSISWASGKNGSRKSSFLVSPQDRASIDIFWDSVTDPCPFYGVKNDEL